LDNDPLNILLVDDDEADRLLFKEAFEELTVKTIVHLVKNGFQLMEYLNQSALLPNLVFLDLNMPGKNGLECLMEIKRTKRFKNIAIAIYSTSASEKDIEETFNNGANVYITKPNDFNTLKKVLDKAVTVALQYQESSSNRDFFLLRI